MTPVAESTIVLVIPIHSRSPVTEIWVASRGAVVKVARRDASTDIGSSVAAEFTASHVAAAYRRTAAAAAAAADATASMVAAATGESITPASAVAHKVDGSGLRRGETLHPVKGTGTSGPDGYEEQTSRKSGHCNNALSHDKSPSCNRHPPSDLRWATLC
jgi:hypothetical protein